MNAVTEIEDIKIGPKRMLCLAAGKRPKRAVVAGSYEKPCPRRRHCCSGDSVLVSCKVKTLKKFKSVIGAHRQAQTQKGNPPTHPPTHTYLDIYIIYIYIYI